MSQADLPGRLPPPCAPDILSAAASFAIDTRRSVRGFLPDPVDPATIRRLLALASRAPSGSNIQPWFAHVLTGATLRRVSAALRRVAEAGEPEIRDYVYYPRHWRTPYVERRRACGWGLYELAGIARGDREGGARQRMRNFDFFGAPVGLVFTIDRDMEQGSWLDYGMFLQTFMIAARGFGLDTCPQAAIASYPDLLRRELSIPNDRLVVCGIALGHADPAEPTNALQTDREPPEAFATFCD